MTHIIWSRLGARLLAAGVVLGLLVALAVPLAARGQAAALHGDFSVTIVKTDVPTDIANGPTAIGKWEISFKPGGVYQLSRVDLGTLVTGTYKINGNKVTITDTGGLLACTNGQNGTPNVATGTYTWSLKGGNLTLKPVQDACAVRKVILSTSTLGPFVACVTAPLISLTTAASPVATPKVSPNAALGAGTPAAGGKATDQAIDNVLKQLTACWATGDPSRVLPLFSPSLLKQLAASVGSLQDVATLLQPLMSLPFTWERSGAVQRTGSTSASVNVRITLKDHQDFLPFNFVLQSGTWKIDTFILGPNDIPGAVPTATAGA